MSGLRDGGVPNVGSTQLPPTWGTQGGREVVSRAGEGRLIAGKHASGDRCDCFSGPGVFVPVSFSRGAGIDWVSESEDRLSSVSVETVGTEEDRGGSSVFTSPLGFVMMSSGMGGTGGGLCGVSIGGGGGAKGGSFNWAGTLRTCRNMAEAYAGQMAKSKFHDTIARHTSSSAEESKCDIRKKWSTHLLVWYSQTGFQTQSNTTTRARRDRVPDVLNSTELANSVEMSRRGDVSFPTVSHEPVVVS